MNWYLCALASLAVFRITHLLAAEDGPWDVLLGLRRVLGASVVGQLMDCFNCLSLWVAVPFALLIGDGWRERGLLWPALSLPGKRRRGHGRSERPAFPRTRAESQGVPVALSPS